MELSKPTLDYRSYAEVSENVSSNSKVERIIIDPRVPILDPVILLLLHVLSCIPRKGRPDYVRTLDEYEDPTDGRWPLAWLVFVCVFFLNPINIFRRRSRYWFLRVLFRVCTPGYSRVEVSQLSFISHDVADQKFIAFFIADELNR